MSFLDGCGTGNTRCDFHAAPDQGTDRQEFLTEFLPLRNRDNCMIIFADKLP